MQFGTLTRGDGKIYVALQANVPLNGSLRVKSFSVAGQKLPALILDGKPQFDGFVLVLAGVSVDQRVEVDVIDSAGALYEWDTLVVESRKAALQSKINTLRRNETVGNIRNIDRNFRLDETHIVVERMEDFFDGRELVHGVIFVPGVDERTAHSRLLFEVIDRQGNLAQTVDFTVMRDSCASMVQGSDQLLRTIEFSFKKPYALNDFFLSAAFEDDALRGGFICLDAGKTAAARNEFAHVYDNGPGTEADDNWRYHNWFMTTQRTPNAFLDVQRDAHFDIEPIFSIVVPLFRTQLSFFHEMVASVCAQTYGKFELVLVNASPDVGELSEAVRKYEGVDNRIKVVELEENLGIALNTAAGIKVASGDFVSFLDHDDVLEPDTLYEYVRALNEDPEADLIYCDEDMLKEGRYVRGFLKPEFDPFLLEGLNYITHMLTIRKSLLDELPQLPGCELDGSQDHAFALMTSERARSVCHVSKVLYHWRIHEHSTAGDNAAEKPWAVDSGKRAIEEHLARSGVQARVVPNALGHGFNLEYNFSIRQPKIAIIIPNKDHVDLLERCIVSITQKSSYANYEIVIVENNSEDEATFAYYDVLEKTYENVKVFDYDGCFNFSSICNAGVKHTDAELLLFLNNDTEVISSDWLEQMAGPLQREEIACVGAKLLYPDDTVQHLGVLIPRFDPSHFLHIVPENTHLYYGYPWFVRSVSAVTGACAMVRRAEFERINGFDERFSVAYNDIDLCLRLRDLGKSIVMQPRATLYHFESASRGYDAHDNEKYARQMCESGIFRQRWSSYYAKGDPFYSRHFARGAIYCDLDWLERAWRH